MKQKKFELCDICKQRMTAHLQEISKIKTEKKALSSAANGRKGGRPKKNKGE